MRTTSELLSEIERLEASLIRHKQMLEVYRREREYFLLILNEYSDKLKSEWFTK
jgi:hypothetical protein